MHAVPDSYPLRFYLPIIVSLDDSRTHQKRSKLEVIRCRARLSNIKTERERDTHREIGKNRETSLVILLSFTTVSIWHCGRGLESQVALSVQKPKSVLGDQWRESDGHHPKHVQLTDQRRNWKAAILDADLLPPLFLNAYTPPYDG